ncbi:MAG: hypothetical protein HRT35_20445, partial [Algicola sp.]|nr:hypothetical protein [Algicola sp.]
QQQLTRSVVANDATEAPFTVAQSPAIKQHVAVTRSAKITDATVKPMGLPQPAALTQQQQLTRSVVANDATAAPFTVAQSPALKQDVAVTRSANITDNAVKPMGMTQPAAMEQQQQVNRLVTFIDDVLPSQISSLLDQTLTIKTGWQALPELKLPSIKTMGGAAMAKVDKDKADLVPAQNKDRNSGGADGGLMSQIISHTQNNDSNSSSLSIGNITLQTNDQDAMSLIEQFKAMAI